MSVLSLKIKVEHLRISLCRKLIQIPMMYYIIQLLVYYLMKCFNIALPSASPWRYPYTRATSFLQNFYKGTLSSLPLLTTYKLTTILNLNSNIS